MTVPTLQAICTAIWVYPTRTLRDGVQIVPATLLEEICVAAWTNAERVAVAAPVVHYHTIEGPSKKRRTLSGPSAQRLTIEGPSKRIKQLTGAR